MKGSDSSMKRLMDRETVMILSMCLVLLVVMFGATVAWFEGSRPVSIMATDIEMDDLGDLYVWVKTDEPAPDESQNIDDEGYIPLPAIGVGDEVNHSIDLDITAQENIEDYFSIGESCRCIIIICKRRYYIAVYVC